ncbi:hypothetical protein E2C01_017831 [Portunus trituberculatus]|uniref:Uncharacterized protein n=1 Tax=Portunus trituberculatus TaxID=210409 RepID=A0A5B7DUK1_PORTR|nr:hypothetical protein [Portunus trituberculatus]
MLPATWLFHRYIAGPHASWQPPPARRRGTVEPCVLWDPRGLQAHGFESCPRSECRLGFLTRGNGFLSGSRSR